MIIKTARNGSLAQLHRHLMRQDDGNEEIRLVEVRGCVFEDDLKFSLKEMAAVASGSAVQKAFFHVSFAAPIEDGPKLDDGKWLHCADRYEEAMGLEGHQRAVVHHFKDGRWHQHVVWNRVNPDTGLSAQLAHDWRIAKRVARDLELELGLTQVSSQKKSQRQAQRPPLSWEKQAARRTKVDAEGVRDQIHLAWQVTDNGRTFKAALEGAGLMLARGERRPYVVLDAEGNFYALSSRVLPGDRSKTIAAKLKDVQHDLPELEQAREIIAQRQKQKTYRRKGGATADGGPALVADPTTDPIADRYRDLHVKLKRAHEAQGAKLDPLLKSSSRQQERELAKFDRTAPESGLLAKLTGQAKRRQQAWEKQRAELVRAQETERKRLEAEKRALEERYQREAAELRQKEKAETALRVKFHRQAQQELDNVRQPARKQGRSRRRGDELGE